MPRNRIIAIDPGKTNGFAMLAVQDGKVAKTVTKNLPWAAYKQHMAKLTKLLLELPENQQKPIVIYEQFRIREGEQNNFIWQEMEVLRSIGIVELLCEVIEITPVIQQPSALRMGARYSGVSQPSNHAVSHQVDALNHAYFYGVTKGLIKTERVIYDGFN